MIFRLTVLPAREGDCLLVTYGPAGECRMLVDGGRTGTWNEIRRKSLLEIGRGSCFETIVVTHIDRDHIEGILKLCADQDFKAEVGDFWFNAYRHLDPQQSDEEEFGPAQAEQLSIAIETRRWDWNARFGGGPIRTEGGNGPLPTFQLAGGLRVTLLSPTADGLRSLKPEWTRWLVKAGLKPEQGLPSDELPADGIESFGVQTPDLDALCARAEESDAGVPNMTSIAFLLEYGGKTLLMGADAHPDVLEAALGRLSFSKTKRLRLDLFKVPHHGSGRNITKNLLSMIDCTRFVISSDGSHHEHPDDVALARIVRSSEEPKTIYCNYSQDRLAGWLDGAFSSANKITLTGPSRDSQGLLMIDV